MRTSKKYLLLLLVFHTVLFIFGIRIIISLFPYGFVYHCWGRLLAGFPIGNILDIIYQLLIDFVNGCFLLLVFLFTYAIYKDIKNIIKKKE